MPEAPEAVHPISGCVACKLQRSAVADSMSMRHGGKPMVLWMPQDAKLNFVVVRSYTNSHLHT